MTFRCSAKLGAKVRLFCCPYAGGSASVFRDWHKTSSSKDIEICAFQLPGRGDRMGQPFVKDFHSLIRGLSLEILPLLDRPFAFFGHSMGALICFELIRQLRQIGQPMPVYLFASGRTSPCTLRTLMVVDMTDDLFLESVLARYNPIPDLILNNKELMKIVLETSRADFLMIEKYVYHKREPLSCSIIAFSGSEDREVDIHKVRKWKEHTSKNFDLIILEGNHLFLNDQAESIMHFIRQALISTQVL